MKVTNTQLAAALDVLGYGISLSTDFNTPEVIFEFEDNPTIVHYERQWRELLSGSKSDDGPLPQMFKVARARQWVLDQVIHGHHNESLELPSQTMQTNNFHLAVCLVADGQYLLKLDKDRRVFHFPIDCEEKKQGYQNETQEFYYGRMYLRTLEQLVRRINNRNFTRQRNQDAITCDQK